MTRPLYQFLNIPSLNEEYTNKIRKLGHAHADRLRDNPGTITNIDETNKIVAYDRNQFLEHFPETNVMGQEFVFFDDDITAYLESLFEGFDTPTFALNVLFNMGSPDKPAVAPVHNDTYRAEWVANYLIESGGDVKTSFYEPNVANNRTDKNSGFYWRRSEYDGNAILEKKYETGRWYWFDSIKPHSVSNIATTRLLLTMSSHDPVDYLLARYGI